MKIVQINTVPNGSTGSIMMNIHKGLLKKGHESYVVWGRGRKANNENEIYMKDRIGVYFHVLYSRLTGKIGFASKRATKKLLLKLDEIKPDIIHLHNLHGYYINIELLFEYIKNNNIKVIWTLHDCWAFTGHCVHFEGVNCNKWKKFCDECIQSNKYPKTFVDNSKWCFKRKKEIFSNIKNCTIITPSDWLANLVRQSFLNKYDINVINNGIDVKQFKKIDKEKLQFRKKYNLDNKKIILGVANQWTEEKGLKEFFELSQIINNDKIKIVLVGLNKKQIRKIPKNILGIEKTMNAKELVDIYNSADIFLNTTHEDNYPTVNLEALACGLPIITYDIGGCAEIIKKSNLSNEYIIHKNNDINTNCKNFARIINKLSDKKIVNTDEDLLDVNIMIKKYIDIYNEGEINEKNK